MIYDLEDNPLSAAQLAVTSGDGAQFSVKIDCSTGKALRASVTGDIAISAKQENQSSFTDLENSSGLALSTWNAQTEIFIIRLIAAAGISAIEEKTFSLTVENV